MIALSLTNVSKSFGSVEVLKDINLTVEEGEFVVFVGPSGCGKSTLLRVVAGLEDPTTGTVEIAGKTVTEVPPMFPAESTAETTRMLSPSVARATVPLTEPPPAGSESARVALWTHT